MTQYSQEDDTEYLVLATCHATTGDLLFDDDDVTSRQSSHAAARQAMGIPPEMPAFWDSSQTYAWAHML
jgi:hypothetical protein